MKISVTEQSRQWQMKQNKIKVKKESNNKWYIEYYHKKKLLGYVRLLRYSYGKKV